MNLLDLVTWTGTFVFALTGALKARASRMDIFGGMVMAFATAYGGGTLRDLLIGIKPVNWINDYVALLLVLSGTMLVFLRKEKSGRFEKAILFTDAIGLGMFTAAGIEIYIKKWIERCVCTHYGDHNSHFWGVDCRYSQE